MQKTTRQGANTFARKVRHFVQPKARGLLPKIRRIAALNRPPSALRRLVSRKCKHSSSSLRSQAMRHASFGAVLSRTAAITRSKTKGKKMRVYSLNELFCLTRAELFALHAEIAAELVHMPENSNERLLTVANLRSIRRVLSRHDLCPS
jgi:hypothetical protein